MSKELIITNEDIELLKEMKDNCLKSTVYDDEKSLLKANALTKFLMLYQSWNELKKYIGSEWYCFDNESVEFEVAKDILNKMQELESNNENV